MSWPFALRSSTLWERGTGGVSGLSLAGGSNSDSLLVSELSESDPEMLETSPARERKLSSGEGQGLTKGLPKTLQVTPRASPQPQNVLSNTLHITRGLGS